MSLPSRSARQLATHHPTPLLPFRLLSWACILPAPHVGVEGAARSPPAILLPMAAMSTLKLTCLHWFTSQLFYPQTPTVSCLVHVYPQTALSPSTTTHYRVCPMGSFLNSSLIICHMLPIMHRISGTACCMAITHKGIALK